YATLPAGTTSFTDSQPPTGVTAYDVRLSNHGSTGLKATCQVEVLAPASDALCQAEGEAVRLSWTNPVPYTTIVITRNGLEATPAGGLPGTATQFLDQPVSPGLYLYEIRGLAGADGASPVVSCKVEVLLFPIRLNCTALDGQACLRWINPRAYEGIQVLRDGQPVATLPGDATGFCEGSLPPRS